VTSNYVTSLRDFHHARKIVQIIESLLLEYIHSLSYTPISNNLFFVHTNSHLVRAHKTKYFDQMLFYRYMYLLYI